MDCLTAQQLLSESSDGEVTDAARLAEANAHCAACPRCTAFARGLMSLRTPGPKAPESLIASISAQVSDEIAREQIAREAAAAAAAAEPVLSVVPAPEVADAPVTPRPRPDSWRNPWALTAAAAVLVGFALLTQYGITLMNGPLGGQDSIREVAGDSPAPEAASPQTNEAPPTGPTDSRTDLSAPTEAPAFVALQGRVYRSQGASDASGTAPASIGTVRTARDGTGVASSVNVYADPARADWILLPGAKEGYIAFAPVMRTLGGSTYVLTADRGIERFGEWPSLPARYPEPATPDGSPIFFEWGVDDAGVVVYVPRGRGPEGGFAIAPGAPPADPSAGNPNWTWWEPRR